MLTPHQQKQRQTALRKQRRTAAAVAGTKARAALPKINCKNLITG
jgi:hypothetical protein